MEGNEMRYSFTMALAAGAMLLSAGEAAVGVYLLSSRAVGAGNADFDT